MNTPGTRTTIKLASPSRFWASVVAAALVLALFAASPLRAQNINWVGGTSTDWNTASNWSSGTVPISTNTAILDTNSGNQVVINAETVSGGAIVVGNSSASGANTSLIISGGSAVTVGTFLIANGMGSTGSVLVTDPGTVLTTPQSGNTIPLPYAQVGVNGTASLTIANGAKVLGMSVTGNLPQGNATVLVTGDGSQWWPGTEFNDSVSGKANITVANGGNINTSLAFFIRSNNAVTITGVAASGNHSTLAMQFDRLFFSGNNSTLTIANGGQVSAPGGLFVEGNSNTILVTDSGSALISGNLGGLVGTYGFYLGVISSNNTLTVANGANFTSAESFVGYSANSTDSVTVTGAGSVWNATGNIVLGNITNSTGSLTLANGGNINITGGNIVFGLHGGNGTLNLNAGAFFQDGNANGSLVFSGGNTTINWNGGTMQATANLAIPVKVTISEDGSTFDSNGHDSSFFGNISGSGSFIKGGNGNLTFTNDEESLLVNTGIQSYTGNITINGGSLILTHTYYPGGNVSANITDNANLTLDISSATYSGVLSGNGNVSINSGVTLAGNNTFTGNMQCPQSTFLTFSGDLSQIGGNLVLNGGPLFLTQNFDTTYAANISGSIQIQKNGTGNLTLSGNYLPGSGFSTLSSISVNSGNVTFTGFTSQLTSTRTSNPNGYVAAGSNITFQEPVDGGWTEISGAGNFVQAGTGNLTLWVDDLAGNLIIESGTLVVGYVTSQSGNIIDSSSLVFTPRGDDASPAAISGTGAVTLNVAYPGNFTLSGNCTYTGPTTITNGTLLMDGQLAAASNVTVNNGAALGGNGTVLGPVTIAAGGMLMPGDNGEYGANFTGNFTFLGTLSLASVSLDPAATTFFYLIDPGNYSNLSVTSALAETGNVVITLDDAFVPGTFQLISSTGGLSHDFGNVTVTGLYSTALTDSGGMWTGSTSGVNFAFHATTGQLVVNYTIVPLSPTGTTDFSITDPGNYSNLTVAGTLSEAGNVVLNLNGNLHAGTYQLINSNGGTSNDFGNVTLAGLYSGALTDNGGVWTGNVSGVNFTFNAATGQLVVAPPLPSGISDTKIAWLEQYFTIPQLLDSTISGDAASPAGDGISNFMKYAFNLNPLVNGEAGLPQVSTDGTYLYLFFVPQQTDVNYNFEASTDLATWSSDGIDVYYYNADLVGSYLAPATGTVFMHVVVSPVNNSPNIVSSGGYDSSLADPSTEQGAETTAAATWAADASSGVQVTTSGGRSGNSSTTGGRGGSR